METYEKVYFFPVHNLTIYDLYDWACKDNDSRGTVVNRTMVKVKNQSSPRLSRSPSRKSSLRAGSLVKVNEQDVALFRYGDVVYAISEHCPHAGGPLHVGDIEDVPGKSLCVRCPYHGWKFDLETGKCCHPKSRGDLSAIVYPVRVDPESGEMAVGFDQFNPFYFTGSSF
nr:cytidine monophosphate-N-acetylneuraminic acid hydroxylase-like isoform X1 [Penaeus vannamei]